MLDALPEPQHVPSQGASDLDGTVGEAMQFFESHGLAVEESGHDAAALGSKIDRQVTRLGHAAHDSDSVAGSWWR